MNFLELYEKTNEYRQFNSATYLEAKLKKINDFFREERLDAAVVGVSGGIDSALTINLFREAQKLPGSPIHMIEGVIAPIIGKGVTGHGKCKRYNRTSSLFLRLGMSVLTGINSRPN